MSRHRRAFLASLGGGLSFLSGCASGERPSADRTTPTSPRAIVVDGARGSAAGEGTDDAPYGTIMRGFEAASPGDTIEVRPGEYAEPVVTPHGGEPGKPITITGPPEAVLTSDRDRFQPLKIQDSHVHLRGLTVDGLWDPDNPEDPSSYAHSPLIQPRPRADTDEYLVDLVVAPHRVGNARAHVISTTRVRDVEIGPMEVIGPAGTYYLLDDDVAGHVGEIVYLGTPPDTYGKSHYPWDGLDLTRNVHVHHVDNSAGHWHSELVNTKLGTRNVLVEYCTDGGGSQNEHDSPPPRSGSRATTPRFAGVTCETAWRTAYRSTGAGRAGSPTEETHRSIRPASGPATRSTETGSAASRNTRSGSRTPTPPTSYSVRTTSTDRSRSSAPRCQTATTVRRAPQTSRRATGSVMRAVCGFPSPARR